MSYKKIIPYINAENEILSNVIDLAKKYSYSGADELIVYNYSKDEKSREEFLSMAKELSKVIDVPFTIGLYIDRLEDVKKALYTGASFVLIKYSLLDNKELIKECATRFGSHKIIIEIDMMELLADSDKDLTIQLKSLGAGMLLLKHVTLSSKSISAMKNSALSIIIRDSLVRNDIVSLITLDNVSGVSTNFYENKDLMKVKRTLKEDGININSFESSFTFSELKTDNNGLIPVITQDIKTGEVLMLAYMNEEAYNKTIAEGRMNYYSRSRQSLWLKGETSGHFQYLKELSLDCDKDTLLAKVLQVEAACHTGSHSCFFNNLVQKEYKSSDPLHVLQNVYNVIMDRKINPKEGSYTNYLFDKGIDKILKKCGEEAAEIIIAAKNPDTEELRYEIADYLYHIMVLMAERGLDWKDITTELDNRK